MVAVTRISKRLRSYLVVHGVLGQIYLRSPRPMRLRPENGECSNRWESLIFQSGFKLSKRAPINPEKQHLRRKQIHSDCESLRLLIT